jgi:hypothetical protein
MLSTASSSTVATAISDSCQLPAVPEHHRQEHEQERHVEEQRDRGAADELADGFDAVQARDQRAGGPLLEITQVQPQQVAEDLAAEYRIDAVAGMQDEILPQPGEKRAEQQEQQQRGGDRDQRTLRLVDNHLVDHHLREQRRRQPDQLQHQRGQQHVTPDGFVAQQLRHKPAETEAAGIKRRRVPVRRIGDIVAAHQQNLRLEMPLKIGEWQRLAAG